MDSNLSADLAEKRRGRKESHGEEEKRRKEGLDPQKKPQGEGGVEIELYRPERGLLLSLKPST